MSAKQIKAAFCSTPAKVIYAVGIVAGIGLGLYFVHIHRTEVKTQVAPVLRPTELVLTGKPLKKLIDKHKNKETLEAKEPEQKAPEPSNTPKTISTQPEKQGGNRRRLPLDETKVGFEEEEAQPSVAKKPFVPIDLYPGMAAKNDNIPQGIYAPYGMQVRCQLAKSISTSNLKTPIIAQVMENLEWEGEIVIPAGVIVHGTVSGSPQRDRIGTSDQWILVWPFRDETSGLELTLTGDALDCNRTPDGGWGQSDGTGGIRGEVVDNTQAQKMYAAMATFLSGLGEGMVSTENDYVGNSTIQTTGGSWKDSLGKALQRVGEQVSQDLIRNAIASAYYVQAEAGTQFYIYVRQVIDVDEAKRGTRPRNASATKTSPINNNRKSR